MISLESTPRLLVEVEPLRGEHTRLTEVWRLRRYENRADLWGVRSTVAHLNSEERFADVALGVGRCGADDVATRLIRSEPRLNPCKWREGRETTGRALSPGPSVGERLSEATGRVLIAGLKGE